MTSNSAQGPGTILWLRRDLRISDHPGWKAALDAGGPVYPLFILDPLVEAQYGAAPLWRLGESLAALSRDLESHGSKLILRRGEAQEVLESVLAETGARRVVWSRLYDLRSIERDTAIKTHLKAQDLEVVSVNASLLHEPWTVETKTGGIYRVYTPFWKSVRGREVPEPLSSPADLAAPEAWPASDRLSEWQMGRNMRRGAPIVAKFAVVGEASARARLEEFIDERIDRYKSERDLTDRNATSGLSENLTYGEISPVTVWHAGYRAMTERGRPEEAETFLKELVWREFAYHLLFHTPEIETRNWRGEWDQFPWREDNPQAERWRRGMTGIEMVDAAMREMYVTGTMHNRTRMLTASFLTKHLLTDWKIGEAWFRDCLIDWDIAANAMGWQWTAGSGPDAAPYFRVYNPDTQAEKFDKSRAYRDRFIAEGKRNPHNDALAFFEAAPRAWEVSPSADYPSPVIGLADGRERALEAYRNRPKSA